MLVLLLAFSSIAASVFKTPQLTAKETPISKKKEVFPRGVLTTTGEGNGAIPSLFRFFGANS